MARAFGFKAPYKIRLVVERFKTDGIERDRLECGHVVSAKWIRVGGKWMYDATATRRCTKCGQDFPKGSHDPFQGGR